MEDWDMKLKSLAKKTFNFDSKLTIKLLSRKFFKSQKGEKKSGKPSKEGVFHD